MDEHEQKPSATDRLVDFATMLFGEEWASDVARVAGVNLRTVQRIQADARKGTDNRTSAGVLSALKEKLVNGMLRADGEPEHQTDIMLDVMEARKVVGRYSDGWQMEMDAPFAGPFKAVSFWQMIAAARQAEQSLYDLLNAGIDFYNQPNCGQSIERFEDAIYAAVDEVDALIALEPSGQIIRVRAPRPPVFGTCDKNPVQWGWPTDLNLNGVVFISDDPLGKPKTDAFFAHGPVEIGSTVGFLIDDEALPSYQPGEPLREQNRWLAFVYNEHVETVKKQYETAGMKIVVDEFEHH